MGGRQWCTTYSSPAACNFTLTSRRQLMVHQVPVSAGRIGVLSSSGFFLVSVSRRSSLLSPPHSTQTELVSCRRLGSSCRTVHSLLCSTCLFRRLAFFLFACDVASLCFSKEIKSLAQVDARFAFRMAWNKSNICVSRSWWKKRRQSSK